MRNFKITVRDLKALVKEALEEDKFYRDRPDYRMGMKDERPRHHDWDEFEDKSRFTPEQAKKIVSAIDAASVGKPSGFLTSLKDQVKKKSSLTPNQLSALRNVLKSKGLDDLISDIL